MLVQAFQELERTMKTGTAIIRCPPFEAPGTFAASSQPGNDVTQSCRHDVTVCADVISCNLHCKALNISIMQGDLAARSDMQANTAQNDKDWEQQVWEEEMAERKRARAEGRTQLNLEEVERKISKRYLSERVLGHRADSSGKAVTASSLSAAGAHVSTVAAGSGTGQPARGKRAGETTLGDRGDVKTPRTYASLLP